MVLMVGHRRLHCCCRYYVSCRRCLSLTMVCMTVAAMYVQPVAACKPVVHHHVRVLRPYGQDAHNGCRCCYCNYYSRYCCRYYRCLSCCLLVCCGLPERNLYLKRHC